MSVPFPVELITLMGATAFSGVVRAVSMASRARREERLLSLHAMSRQGNLIQAARQCEVSEVTWTRRVITLTTVFFVVVFPKLMAVCMPDVPVHVGYPDVEKGFFLFSSGVERVHWVMLRGVVITPLDTHLLSAIIGLYFGGAIATPR
ncbi:MAG: hypothetical protein B7X06_00080 [Verrucomicrobia bacterium 21-51-4]|nr:MAG: hypothetical protein B7X06_00080 [Verrucomicrobia bacterium 21-51-4]HQU08364.1 hypothetical protein [Opitutales bacterium]